MVEGMCRRGDAVTVWNRTRAKADALAAFGARVAATPEQAIEGAEAVHMTFPDDAVVDAILARLLPRLAPGALVLDHSTTSPSGTRDRVPRMASHGVKFLHAPVFMSPQMARESKGLVLASGPAAVYEEARPRLEPMGAEVLYLGERPDLAAAYKIFGNSMLFAITGGLADVLAMAKNLAVAPEDALSIFSKFNVATTIPFRGAKMARRDFSASFELTMARKDIGLMLEAAGPEPLAALPGIAERMDEAIAAGHGRDDLAAIVADVV
jgi:3-hydroxyisobutyrate dehydrogenase